MPAVENLLGPCRKPKYTISGWTLTHFLRRKDCGRFAEKDEHRTLVASGAAEGG